MEFNPKIHHRRSIRLAAYDYSSPGAYYITICTSCRKCLFGEIVSGRMRLNEAGLIVETWWWRIESKFPCVQTDTYVVMPNHFHGILLIGEASESEAGAAVAGQDPEEDFSGPLNVPGSGGPEGGHAGPPLPTIVQWFKTMTTNEYMQDERQEGWTPLKPRLWQRNYFEHVIRSEQALNRLRRYIDDNPFKWEDDPENPKNR